ncbi:hypothetical protein LZA78_15155 [Sinirhodobacter sp. WL0062]|uniref:Lipoprotein n=1 Tax=Rhodobacter flavimaris TaxID=2907145 RepID=A0ABS8Z4G5_9RHOB|nr:hypothetical protein [Sinirhodobacter sp. WL0062]MCE5974825.1 hypothetical protein [Sinirhodobacter sp. WL0062]
MLGKKTIVALLMAAAVIAGCAQIEEDIGECEPGVADISQVVTAVPSCV